MFYLIGLGLGDFKDITVKGLEIVKKCSKVYLEYYTAILDVPVEVMEEFYGRKLIIADRNLVEENPEKIYETSNNEDIALLVVGDPMCATTHSDLYLRIKQDGYSCKIIHNSSIISAVGCVGLQVYRFGEIVSIPFWSSIGLTGDILPDGFYDKISDNYCRNLHTLCLLDIRVKEPTIESLLRGKKLEYEPPKFMTAAIAAQQLIDVINYRFKINKSININKSTMCIGLARIGTDSQVIKYCTIEEMCDNDLGKPLHSLIIPAQHLHCLESEFLEACFQ